MEYKVLISCLTFQVEDEFLKQAQNAARAKTLRAKFEHWEETTDGKTTQQQHVEMDIAQTDGSQPSIESASSLRARFESLGSQPSETPRTPKVKVNRFVVSFKIYLSFLNNFRFIQFYVLWKEFGIIDLFTNQCEHVFQTFSVLFNFLSVNNILFLHGI